MDPAPTDSPPAVTAGGPAATRRKGRGGKWLAAGIGAVLLVAVFVGFGGGSSGRLVTVGVAGVTNMSGVPTLWFWVTNGSRPLVGYGVNSVCVWDGSQWKDDGNKHRMLHSTYRKRPDDSVFVPPHQVFLTSVSVAQAQGPFQVGVGVWAGQSRVDHALMRVKGWFGRLRYGTPVPTGQVITYTVTNEFWRER